MLSKTVNQMDYKKAKEQRKKASKGKSQSGGNIEKRFKLGHTI